MRKSFTTMAIMGAMLAIGAQAHFLVMLPSRPLLTGVERGGVMTLLFTHPMEQGPVMEMAKPVQFGVLANGQKKDLLATLERVEADGRSTYRAAYVGERPGDLVFYCEPAPYWEPAEGKMIVHFTKVIVDAFGAEEGWDAMVGFPVEVEPLVRPYGLWTGNLFRGIVRKHGEPVAFAEIEVEYWNEGGQVKVPGGAFVTQVIKADAQGVFSYAMPRAGWWGFAALVDGDKKLKNPAGEEVDVELGALIWVQAVDMK